MKKILCVLISIVILSTSVTVFADTAVTMYAPDGRTASVPAGDVAAWKSVGWFDSPPVIMYAPGGKSAYVGSNDVAAWKAVGWFESPPIIMYAPDGRTAYVGQNDVAAWKAVGWYTAYVPDTATINRITGRWGDEYSQRCHMTITYLYGNKFKIEAWWGNSADDTSCWEMTASLSADGTLSYNNCHYYRYTRWGKITQFKNGVGNFKYKNGYYYWNNITGDDYRCYFIKLYS